MSLTDPVENLKHLQEEVFHGLMALRAEFAHYGETQLEAQTDRTIALLDAALGDVKKVLKVALQQRDNALLELSELEEGMERWETTKNRTVRDLVQEIEADIAEAGIEADRDWLVDELTDEIHTQISDALANTGISRAAAEQLAAALIDGTLAGDEEALEVMAAAAAYGLGYAEGEQVEE
jgi:hypothetical protein